jgi:hypothetical protein
MTDFRLTDALPHLRQNTERAPPRARILREAERLICGDKEAEYGPPAESFARAAAYASLATGLRLTPADVVRVLWAVKCSRLNRQSKADSHVDRIGYDALLAEVPDSFSETAKALTALCGDAEKRERGNHP